MNIRAPFRTSNRAGRLTGLLVGLTLTAVTLSAPVAALGFDGNAVSDVQALIQPAGQSFELTGKIVSVDYAANVIVVRSHGDRMTIAITPTTAVDRDGQPGGISDLRAGVRVHVTGSERDGLKTADSIEILAPADSHLNRAPSAR
jgi:hypothetical protein